MSKSIYDLELHEELLIAESQNKQTVVTRVPGGWLYSISNAISQKDGNYATNSTVTFVPLNNEFKQKKVASPM